MLQQQNLEVQDLRAQLDAANKKAQDAERELNKVKADTIPQVSHLQDQLRSQEIELKQKYHKEYLEKEEPLQNQLIKQKYEIKDQFEKNKMMKNENTELKI